MVFALHLINNDLAGENPVALLLQVEANVEVAEVLLIKGVFADAEIQGAPVALVALQQGLPQGRFHHLRRQLLLFTDVVDQVAETGKQDESHRVGLGEKKGAVAGAVNAGFSCLDS